MNKSIVCELNAQVTAEEIMAVREDYAGDAATWRRCISESMCVATVRDSVNHELLGVGFLVGNSRHVSLVDLTVHSSARELGIGGKIVDTLIEYAKSREVKFFGLTYDTNSPWLQGFYERHGFQLIDFAMWHKDSLNYIPLPE